MLNSELESKIVQFLNRVGDGYYELSHDKVAGEYRYFKRKARELLLEIHDVQGRKRTDSESDPLEYSSDIGNF